MWKVLGRSAPYCDGVSRRSCLKAGILGLGGLTVADLFRHRALAGASQPLGKSSVIFVELAGGPTHFETYDPKPNAPSEIRGPLDAIETAIPGVLFSQYMVEQAQIADQLTILRSVRHNSNSHDPSSHLTQTGYYKTGEKGGSNQMPSLGSITARFRGSNHPSLPAYVAVPQVMRNGGAAQLGRAFEPFETVADPNGKSFEVKNLSLLTGLTAGRLNDRGELLNNLDAQRRLLDLHGSSQAVDEFTRQALDLVSGARAREAFDINREDVALRDQYGRNPVGQSMLLARRLVEAGVTCVTVRVTGWDDHSNIAQSLQRRGPEYDRGLAMLIRDLRDRGLEQDVLIVAMGEFGRTPKVNKTAGRDHWGAVMSVVLAGGKLKRGVFGESNANGEIPATSPFRPENVLATVYSHLGIDPIQTFPDLSGRPRFILEDRDVIRAIV